MFSCKWISAGTNIKKAVFPINKTFYEVFASKKKVLKKKKCVYSPLLAFIKAKKIIKQKQKVLSLSFVVKRLKQYFTLHNINR